MRLPLLHPAELTAGQRPLPDALEKMTRDEEYQGSEVKNAEGAFVGPWRVMLHFPDLAVPLGQFINLAQKLPGLSERALQVVIVTIGGRLNVAYELYAHAPLAARAGLRPDQVAALSAGARPADLSEDELLAADVASALTRAGAVPGPLYDAAVARLAGRASTRWCSSSSTTWRSASCSTPTTCPPGVPRPGLPKERIMPDINQTKALLEDPDAFGTFGRFTETPVERMPPQMREAFDFTVKLRGLVPGPHKIWAANPALLTTIAPVGAYYQTASTLSKAEIEIATCVICGRWAAAYSSFEHEKIAVALGKLDPKQAQALIAGLPAGFDDPRQQVVYELCGALAAARVVPQGLFRRAQELLGDAGIADVTVLMGWFTAVSLTLMTYDVPSNATGLDQ